jgi:hypothetical protein
MISKQKGLFSFWSLGYRAGRETWRDAEDEPKDSDFSIPSSRLFIITSLTGRTT